MKRRFVCVMMTACLMVVVLSGCRNKQIAESVGSDRTEEAINSEEVSNDNAAVSGENDEAEAEVVPLAVTIEHVTDTISEERGYETYTYPRFYLDEEDQTNYPELSKAFESHNSKAESEKKAALEELKGDYEAVIEIYADDESWHEMTSETTAVALRADSNVVSILCEYYEYRGTAHGYYYAYGVNYDTKTGKELTLGDVVKDKDAFIELVSDAFIKSYSNTDGYDTLLNAGEALKKCDFDSEEGILWTIDPTSINVYFEPEHLGSYAHGEQVVSVYFDDAPKIFDERYITACEDYVLPVTNRKPLSILSAFGEREEIRVDLDDADYDSYKVVYTIGDTKLESQWDCYSADAYLVHVDGKNYIYAFQRTDNDYTYLSVVDADNRSLDDEKNIGACLKGYYKENNAQNSYESIQGSISFTNPAEFMLGFRVDVLGTYYVYRNCRTGSDGYPVSDDKLYTSGSETAFRALKEIKCDTVDQEGNVTGKATIPVGSFLVVVRTDGESIADMQIIDASFIENPEDEEWPVYHLTEDIGDIVDMDGTIYRVMTDKSCFPHTVNGEDEYNLFEGVMYSG